MSINPTNGGLLKLWEQPTAEWRAKPFWSWNGDLDKDELFRQIHVMKEMGFGGFFMHSRTGLVTEYLGDEWFELINACADEAERLGMEAWLYDEDRWPSGSAGGMATRDPKYRMRYLRMKLTPSEEFTWSDDALATFVCDIGDFHGQGFQYHNGMRLSEETCRDIAPGRKVLTFHVEVMEPDSFYNGAAYLDTMNIDATRHFLEVTHEKYKARCGDRLGSSIKGVFTDEPHRGMVMSSFADHPQSSWVIPWTDKLCAEFGQRFGYDLIARLPEIFLQPFGQELAQVKWHYMELLQALFLENFMQPMHEWCKEHNLLLTGHVLHEDNLCCQAVPNGSMMRNYEFMDYPGVDVLGEGNIQFWLAKQLCSVARQLGKPWLLSELYGCTGWQMSFENHKSVGDWQTLFGINVRCPHLSWYTMEGEAKRDYPASILHQSAWYPHYGYVEDYFSRISIILQQGTPVCDLLVINPVESIWGQIRHGWVNHLTGATMQIQDIERAYADIFHWLSGVQMDFDYGDEDYLSRMASVQKDEDGRPVLVVGKMRYKAVLVAGLRTIRSSTLNLLEAFADAGGSVLCSGDAPPYVDALPDERAAQLWERKRRIPFYQDALTRTCRKVAPPLVEVLDAEFGYNVPSVFAQVRDTAEGRFVMLVRTQRERTLRGSIVRLRGRGSVEEWNCRSGERHRVDATEIDGWLEFATDFPPSSERLYRIVAEADESLKLQESLSETNSRALEMEFPFHLQEPNVCVLDRASYRVDDGEWRGGQDILKIDRALRVDKGLEVRSGRMLQPWFTKEVEKPVLGRVALRFEFTVEVVPEEPVALVLEQPDQYTAIAINGNQVNPQNVDGWWVDTCMKRIPLSADALREGENIIELEVAFHEGINLEAIYLTGNFGVRADKVTPALTRFPERLKPGCVTTQGLPFYGGKITYSIPADALGGGSNGDRVWLRLPQFEAACVRVMAAGREQAMIAFPPYETEITELIRDGRDLELEVILTRRNTFGPLHQVPLRDVMYMPENWLTEGEAYSDVPMLFPAGLLEAPELVVKQAGLPC